MTEGWVWSVANEFWTYCTLLNPLRDYTKETGITVIKLGCNEGVEESLGKGGRNLEMCLIYPIAKQQPCTIDTWLMSRVSRMLS